MSVTTGRLAEPPVWLGRIFDRIVCGVDGSESSRIAVMQAARLLAARRVLKLISVVEEIPIPWPGLSARSDLDRQFAEARCALRDGLSQCPRAWSALLVGDPGQKLVWAAREIDATLAVVGAPASGRLGGFVLGDAGTHVLHNAPCSVLIARKPADEEAFPGSIVVGHDGSAGAAAAVLVAKELAHRFDAALRIVVATGGEPVDVDGLPPAEELDWSSSPPVDALESASSEADLLVVGSRGLRDLRALGSVSEAIGHLAHCSVLVVRETPGPSRVESGVADDVPDLEC
jgi:nucleotide-binding universal stress UspA family protein